MLCQFAAPTRDGACRRVAVIWLTRARPCGHDLPPVAACAGHAEAHGSARADQPSHCRTCGVTGHITFRLPDIMPAARPGDG